MSKSLGSLLLLGASIVFGQTCQTTDIPSNGSFDGALTESDCTVRDYVRSENTNNKADALSVRLRERSVLRLRMTSTQVDPYLYLLNDRGSVLARNDNSGGGKNAEITIQLPSGTYTIVASNAAPGLGDYQMTTSIRTPRSCAPADLSLTGEAVEADLRDTDCSGVDLTLGGTDTLPLDVYRIEVSRPSVLEITMSSQTLAPTVSLWDGRGRRVGSAPASGSSSSRLLISVPEGTFTVRAGTTRAGSGAYRISATRENRRTCEPVPLVAGESFAGEFTRSDCRAVDVMLYASSLDPVDQYKFELKERSIAKLRMQSALLDSILVLVDSDGLAITANDDARPETVDSEIYVSLPPGSYVLWAANYYGDAGRYTLNFDPEKPRGCTPVSFDAPGTAAASLTKDGCRTMDLQDFSESAAPAAALAMKVSERAWTTVSAAGTDMTPLVRLSSSAGVSIGQGGFVPERSVLLLPGLYPVWVTTRDGAAGEVAVTTTTRPPAVCDAAALTVGEPYNGELANSDCPEHEVLPFFTQSASRVDLWKVTLENAGTVRAEVGTEDGLPYAILLDSEFRPIAFALNLTFSPGAQLSYAARAGTFYLVVGSYLGPGAYTVRVTQDGPPTQ